jgi:hypothetical protein
MAWFGCGDIAMNRPRCIPQIKPLEDAQWQT